MCWVGCGTVKTYVRLSFGVEGPFDAERPISAFTNITFDAQSAY